MNGQSFSETIVYVDESGNHGLASDDPSYPIFVLAFCVFRKSEYVHNVVPAMQLLKFKYFGHDSIVLHERDLRKTIGPFARLRDMKVWHAFQDDLSNILASIEFRIIAAIIDKTELRSRYSAPANPYHIAVEFCLERLNQLLEDDGDATSITHVLFESRGAREDDELELEFRRVCDGRNCTNKQLPLDVKIVSKKINSSGLQIADLVARPIGVSALRPEQRNRAYEIIETKFYRGSNGIVDGYGRKVFP